MAYGLFAKNFVADRLGLLVDRAYSGYETQTGFVLMLGVSYMRFSCIVISWVIPVSHSDRPRRLALNFRIISDSRTLQLR